MNEFIEKLIGRLEQEKQTAYKLRGRPHMNYGTLCGWISATDKAILIINRIAEEYNNDFCEWKYDEFEEKWQTDCGALFTLHDSDREITHYCSCCGKKVKVVE